MNEIAERIGRLFMVGIPGPVFDDETRRLLEELNPLSIIFFGRNIISPEQLAKLISDITAFLGRKPVFAIDQEGGIVTRLVSGFTVMPGPMALAAAGDPEAAFDAGLILGREMKAVGIDWDLAPVVDVNRNPLNRGIGVRSYSADTAEVTNYAGRFIDGLKSSGVLCCLKHFPGLGGVETDPHLALPVLNCSREELFEKDLPPFLNLKEDIWMPTHLYIPAIQSRKEAVTVSKEVLTGFIREELGFNGLLLADDLNMGGVGKNADLDNIVIDTFAAGMDILSIAEGAEKQLSAARALTSAVAGSAELQQRMNESIARIDRLLAPFEGGLHQDLSLINTAENRRKAELISERTVKVLKSAIPVPVPEDIDAVFSMKPARLVLIEEGREGLPGAALRIAEEAGCRLIEVERLPAGDPGYAALIDAAEGKKILLFTENAHLEEGMSQFITALAEAAESLHLVVLRNPWDADIPGVENAICSYGYTPDQQIAVYKKITGGY